MAEKRRNRQKEKLRDIHQDTGGNVRYVGDLHRISDSSIRIKLIICLILLTVIVVGSGMIDSANAIGSFYVILPYIGEVAALFAVVWRTVQITWTGEIRTFALDTAKSHIPAACRILTIFAAAGLVLSAAYLLMNGSGGKTLQGAIYLILKLLTAVISEVHRRLFTSAEWEII